MRQLLQEFRICSNLNSSRSSPAHARTNRGHEQVGVLPRHVTRLGRAGGGAMRPVSAMRMARMLRLGAVRPALAIRRRGCILITGIRGLPLVDAEHALDAADHAADRRAD